MLYGLPPAARHHRSKFLEIRIDDAVRDERDASVLKVVERGSKGALRARQHVRGFGQRKLAAVLAVLAVDDERERDERLLMTADADPQRPVVQ